MATCRSCAHENRDGAKFCEECATPLAAPSLIIAEERKVDAAIAGDLRPDYQISADDNVIIDNAAGTLNKLLGESKGPVKNFTETGLNELSMTIRELRQLTANLNVIATKLERDPANFVFSGKQGYTPK